MKQQHEFLQARPFVVHATTYMLAEDEAAAHVVSVIENVNGVMSTDGGKSVFDEDSERMYVTVHGRTCGEGLTEILSSVEADDQVYGADVNWTGQT